MAFNLKSPTVGRLDAGTRVRVLETKYTLDGGLRAAIALASREDVTYADAMASSLGLGLGLGFSLLAVILAMILACTPAPPPPRPHLTLLPGTAG